MRINKITKTWMNIQSSFDSFFHVQHSTEFLTVYALSLAWFSTFTSYVSLFSANYNWVPSTSRSHASSYLVDLLDYLHTTFLNFTTLPVSRQDIQFWFPSHRSTCFKPAGKNEQCLKACIIIIVILSFSLQWKKALAFSLTKPLFPLHMYDHLSSLWIRTPP